MVEQVRAARDAGFASLWFPHHWLTHPLQMLQITPVMGYLAAYARGMTIGPNILILPPLNPVHVAEEAATLDVLTGGNYILGIGLGYRQPEFDAFGVSLKERVPRFNESIALMRRLWTEERVSHHGRFYTVNDAGIGVKPLRPGGPPLYIAGQAEVSVRRAARVGDAWLIVNSSGLGKVAPLMQSYRAALQEFGRTRSNTRSPSNAMSAPAMPPRMKNAASRSNTNTPPTPPGVCRTGPRPTLPTSPATASSSATRFRSRRRSPATANSSASTTSSCAANGLACRSSRC
jgi:alkanesulfonate monooxygenase SsuD/methylene tetrahydromethanopterin reductase-like flavin-dependent oxidoreductase (luciferase family)